ncbi:MAG: hypothetical protein HYT76_00230 [Deltaproteobacteria bacterium]|nr:hypothetical protein [Deltaproteobacteria bacterium]
MVDLIPPSFPLSACTGSLLQLAVTQGFSHAVHKESPRWSRAKYVALFGGAIVMARTVANYFHSSREVSTGVALHEFGFDVSELAATCLMISHHPVLLVAGIIFYATVNEFRYSMVSPETNSLVPTAIALIGGAIGSRIIADSLLRNLFYLADVMNARGKPWQQRILRAAPRLEFHDGREVYSGTLTFRLKGDAQKAAREAMERVLRSRPADYYSDYVHRSSPHYEGFLKTGAIPDGYLVGYFTSVPPTPHQLHADLMLLYRRKEDPLLRIFWEEDPSGDFYFARAQLERAWDLSASTPPLSESFVKEFLRGFVS